MPVVLWSVTTDAAPVYTAAASWHSYLAATDLPGNPEA
jgi:hypothetical protein